MHGPMADEQHVIARLLNTPDIARVVPHLPPEVLHRVIERCGLEASADIVALATPRQLQRVLDLDLWRPPKPGADEALDAARFGEWLEVLSQMGAETAAERLMAMDRDLVIGALAEHMRVFDEATVLPYVMLHGEEVKGRAFGGAQVSEIGGFIVEGRGSSAWEAVVDVLAQLQSERPVFFHHVMRGCVALSNSEREADGFHDLMDDRDQYRADLAIEREARRDRLGYVPPAQARAFLQASRQMRLDGERPPADPVARACLRVSAPEPLREDDGPASGSPRPPGDAEPPASDAIAVATVTEILIDEGVLPRPRALLTSGDAEPSCLALVHAFAGSHPGAPEELAFLANVVLGGCAIHGRPFTPQEASDVVLATCNLGLESWPAAWGDRDLVTAFQAGWAVLQRDLCRHAATALADVLATLQCSDEDVHWRLQTLRQDLLRHLRDGAPWRVRDALDAILILDAEAWAVLRALIDECPTLHATLSPSRERRLRVDPTACTFVAGSREIDTVHEYLASLAAVLVG